MLLHVRGGGALYRLLRRCGVAVDPLLDRLRFRFHLADGRFQRGLFADCLYPFALQPASAQLLVNNGPRAGVKVTACLGVIVRQVRNRTSENRVEINHYRSSLTTTTERIFYLAAKIHRSCDRWRLQISRPDLRREAGRAALPDDARVFEYIDAVGMG